MKWQFIALIAGVGVLMVFLLTRLLWRGKKPSRYPYQRNNLLFSADDRAFFRALQDAVGEEYEIFGKIRICDIIVPKKGVSSHAVKNAFNPIEGRHFDFVLCDKKNLGLACAVQLHDKTQSARHNGDDPLTPICENLGLPFVQFPVNADYSVEGMREKLRKAMVKEPFFLVETEGRKEPRISNLDDMKF